MQKTGKLSVYNCLYLSYFNLLTLLDNVYSIDTFAYSCNTRFNSIYTEKL